METEFRARKNLYKALADFQHEAPTIGQGDKGYGYTYASLATIIEVIQPLLQKHGLGFYQTVDTVDGGTFLTTTIFHAESVENIQSTLRVPDNVQLKGMNDFQVLGSAITYLRRYALSAMLGLVTDKDTDGAGEQVPGKKTTNHDVRIKRDQPEPPSRLFQDRPEPQGTPETASKPAEGTNTAPSPESPPSGDSGAARGTPEESTVHLISQEDLAWLESEIERQQINVPDLLRFYGVDSLPKFRADQVLEIKRKLAKRAEQAARGKK